MQFKYLKICKLKILQEFKKILLYSLMHIKNELHGLAFNEYCIIYDDGLHTKCKK